MARNYSNTFLATTLNGSINGSTTSVTLTSVSGLPGSFPYTLAIEPETASIELVTVTGLAGSTLTVTRGVDGTSAQAHTSGSVVIHPVTARDLKEPQDHIDATTNVHGLAGGAAVVGTTTAQTLTGKTLSGAANTLTNIGNASISDLAASKLTGNFPAVTSTGNIAGVNVSASGTLSATGSVTFGSTLGVTGASTLAAAACTTLAASSNATVGGTLGVTGATTVAALSATTGAFSGGVTAGGALGVTGNTTVGGTLGITGATTAGAVTGTTINGTTDVQRGGVSLSRGVVGGKEWASTSANFVVGATSEVVTGMSTGNVALVNGRRYKVTFRFKWDTGATANGRGFFTIRKTNISGDVLGYWISYPSASGTGHMDEVVANYDATATGNVDFVLTVQVYGSGAVTVARNGNTYDKVSALVEDVGLTSQVTAVA